MAQDKIAVIVLAAGMGTRMKSALPKVMHPVAGRPMVQHLLDTVSGLSPEKVVVVVGPGMDAVEKAVAPHKTVVQVDRLGTAHAVKQAKEALAGFDGTIFILYGDTPLITCETLDAMLAARKAESAPAVVVLGFTPAGANEYGRLVVGPNGLEAIVEFKDASPEQRAIRLCNSGVMAVDGKALFPLIDKVRDDNAKKEFYLTDIVGLARAEGSACAVVEGDEEELLGVNCRSELATAEAILQKRLRQKAMDDGVTLTDPASVFFAWDTKLGRDVTIEPNVVFGPGVTVGDAVEIRAFCHFTGVSVGSGCIIGPFARLRPGAVLGNEVHIGNFVEIKATSVEDGAKINHLAYVGDARVGAAANVGAGTITCNYDGYDKHFTDIGAGAFIGSNSSLVAPVTIGDGAITGAGSVITKNVATNALAVARGAQMELPNWGERFRSRKQAEKAAKAKE